MRRTGPKRTPKGVLETRRTTGRRVARYDGVPTRGRPAAAEA